MNIFETPPLVPPSQRAPQPAPCGSWQSPIEARLLASANISLSHIWVEGQEVFWLEGRPLEKGRVAIVRRDAHGSIRDLLPADFNARTTVHEYGGGAYFIKGESIFFSHFADQRLYALSAASPAPQPITPEPPIPWGLRYADGQVTPDGKSIVCVRQRHRNEQDADNELVILPVQGGEAVVLASGYDFYSDPRLSPDGKKLAWLCWNHPNMPWDGCELWLADFSPQGLANPQQIAGGPAEAIFQPQWSPAGKLHFVSDRTGWWNLYRYDGQVEALCPMEAEFGQPQWVFGLSNYTFLPENEGDRFAVACLYSQNGIDHLGILSSRGELRPLNIGYTQIASLRYGADRLWAIAASPLQSPAIIAIEPASGRTETIRQSSNLALDPAYISIPQAIEFPTENGLTAHALFYPPVNPDFTPLPGEKPPLLVISHGGPTSASKAVLSLSIQFWTSRGFSVVDVNYGGSSGYGRAYRQRLNGQWGIVDVQDCINAARYLIAQGLADPRRVAVRGGSAGGYTTLMALTQSDFFRAGASYYGIADLEPFAHDTHKFESRYLDRLIGPYPAAQELYRQRSPIHFVDRISCPMILFQGLEDKVVPPSQAEIMVRALETKGLPYAYLPFEGEQHGFRKAETIQRAAEAELYFYSRIFGFDLGASAVPIEIKNLN